MDEEINGMFSMALFPMILYSDIFNFLTNCEFKSKMGQIGRLSLTVGV
jgi:hypothetical protein